MQSTQAAAAAIRSLPPSSRARTTCRVSPLQVVKIICHREKDLNAEFLVLWRYKNSDVTPVRGVASWHDLDELSECLSFVQDYCNNVPATDTAADAISQFSNQRSLKRKAPGAEPSRDHPARDHLSAGHQLLTPTSRSASVSSSGSSIVATDMSWLSISIYNGKLRRCEGWITGERPKGFLSNTITAADINATSLPTEEMKLHAASNSRPVKIAVHLIRQCFMEKLRAVKELYLENRVDDTTPSLEFRFVKEPVLRKGVKRVDSGFLMGCKAPCKPNMGANRGCEMTQLCQCLEDAAVDEISLQNRDPAKYHRFMTDTLRVGETLPKRFPYKISTQPGTPAVLQKHYRESRNPIYECNERCNCGPICKSRLVQKGRQVPLTIFKTPNRGWGVKCNEDLLTGEFIDVYLGEIITNEEADKREGKDGNAKSSYLYSLDKFAGEDGITIDNCYVVDGQYIGNATRFINHSCEPNCRQYTVSYNKHDKNIYELGFFAYEDIPGGTELTFDYMDKDEEEEVDVVRERLKAMADPENKDKKPCDCGAAKCRGYLWV